MFPEMILLFGLKWMVTSCNFWRVYTFWKYISVLQTSNLNQILKHIISPSICCYIITTQKTTMNYMGEHVRIQKTFPGEGKGSKGYLCFQGVVWGIFSVNLRNLVFFAPSPTRLSRFPHGRAILSASRNNQYTWDYNLHYLKWLSTEIKLCSLLSIFVI